MSTMINMDEWSCSIAQTRTRLPAHQTHKELPRLPTTTLAEQRALRPRPLKLSIDETGSPPIPKAPPPSRNESASFESPRDPEVVDPAPVWLQRDDSLKWVTSQASAGGRQSEISLGILDYYLREPSPAMQSHDPLPPTPRIDGAIDRLDFGLPNTPSPSIPKRKPPPQNTTAGAQQQFSTSNHPPIASPDTVLTQAYSLFPVIQQVTPPARQPAVTIVDPSPFRDITPGRTSLPSHPQPDHTYRPRKESLSSSARSRADSLNSCTFRRDRTGKLIPLRILSGGSVGSMYSSQQYSSPSSRETSRWSDDTIISPTVASTSGPRTSFSSLLRRDSMQYPACFFEDDDESTPLGRKLQVAWKRSTGGESRRSRGAFDEEESFGRRFGRMMLCGCGGR